MRFTAMIGILLFLAMAPTPALADIFLYIDKEGVMHFSNAPTNTRYRVYMKEGSSTPGPVEKIPKPDTDKYDLLITESCGLHGVDFALVKAVIRAESCFDPYAISSKGAEGLMQLMPETSKKLNVANPFDPHENIKGGVKYLKYLLDRFNYDLKLSLAAYNAGETTVAQINGVPNYRETKNYVAEVMRYYKEYKKKSPMGNVATP
ncbi:MAG: lytic transglycosylase domain-containing protein [Desulfobacterales bacterium]|nr:lytic transglycosylase domain-containing protein [Desulfobacterales bacterium]